MYSITTHESTEERKTQWESGIYESEKKENQTEKNR